MLGSQGEILKRKPWEESIHMPGIVRYPAKIQAGRQTEALFSHVDFAPTLLSLCDIEVPPEMQGTDLSKVLTGEQKSGPDLAYFQILDLFGVTAPKLAGVLCALLNICTLDGNPILGFCTISHSHLSETMHLLG